MDTCTTYVFPEYTQAEILAIADVIQLVVDGPNPHMMQWDSVPAYEPRGWYFTHAADADALAAELEWLAANPDGTVLRDLHF